MKKLILAVVLVLACAPASAQPNRATLNSSVTIATGNTFQQIVPAGSRFSLTIQNNNTNGDSCWLSFGLVNGVAITAGNATKGQSILLGQGGSFQRYGSYVPSDAIIATCASNGDTMYVDTQ